MHGGRQCTVEAEGLGGSLSFLGGPLGLNYSVLDRPDSLSWPVLIKSMNLDYVPFALCGLIIKL